MLYSRLRTSSHFVRCSEEWGRKGMHPITHDKDCFYSNVGIEQKTVLFLYKYDLLIKLNVIFCIKWQRKK